jgi:hypothetical protein
MAENYPYRCILPSDRILHASLTSTTPQQEPTEILAQTESFLSSRSIYIYESLELTDLGKKVTLCELGSRCGFEYLPFVTFQREKQLRDLWQYLPSAEDIPINGEEYTDKINDAYIHHSLCIRRIGLVDGVDVGHGVFAVDCIPCSAMLGEYTGVISDTSCTGSDGLAYCCHYPSADGGSHIDAAASGNVIRFINHSTTPNAAFTTVYIAGIPHIICVSYSLLYFDFNIL